MIAYATLGAKDLAASTAFYRELLAPIGAKELMKMDRIVFFGKSNKEPMLAICIPYDKEQPTVGNGNMLAISPGSKALVDELYQKAISLGATCDGEPGQRIPNVFYGAYIRDLDGHKIAFSHFG